MAYLITENCTGCTACIRRCPTDAITGERHGLHVIAPERCIDCGACGVICPDEAIYDELGELCLFVEAKRRPLAYVELEACVGCEQCVWSCPFDALRMIALGPDGHFGVAELVTRKCVGCTLCERDCPYDAIHIWNGGSPEAEAALERARVFTEAVASRRSDAAE
ncbi:MAG: 4Fe-4S binding protein [Myxococcales bacterium]|nr:4Fe-4S binding protein [Myxococcales bacterium]